MHVYITTSIPLSQQQPVLPRDGLRIYFLGQWQLAIGQHCLCHLDIFVALALLNETLFWPDLRSQRVPEIVAATGTSMPRLVTDQGHDNTIHHHA